MIEDDFKTAMGSWASGVSVVMTRHDGLAYGITVSSFTSLSFDPLLILVCVANTNRLPEMVRRSGVFSVSLLSEGQRAVSNYFASSGRAPVERFDGIETDESHVEVPIVRGSLASVACTLHSMHVVGDHTICCGEVVAATTDPAQEPLLYYRRNYRSLAPLSD